MTVRADSAPRPGRKPLRARLLNLLARPDIQAWAARFPLTRGRVRREGAALFDLVQGFVSSQVLMAIVELRLCHRLMESPAGPADLADGCGLSPDRMMRLLQAGAALGLFHRRRDRLFELTPAGAALTGVPGLEAMIAHHRTLYRDLADPVAFLRGETSPELADLWPYVFGAGAADDPDRARHYSSLMADTQSLVAADTLRAAPLTGVKHLLDVGGGTGVFAEAAAEAEPDLRVTLYDLPAVIDAARSRLDGHPAGERIACVAGSFRDDPLPTGADAVSLIRVLYDHDDSTVRALLGRVHAVLPPGGRLIVSEPMSGGPEPDRAGDVYFAFYCMAMRTGCVRSPERIARLCTEAGFGRIRSPRPNRAFVTRTLTAVRR